MKGLIKYTVMLAGLALALITTAQEQLRRSGDMEPMDSEQMDAARVPLTSEADQSDDDSSNQEWLEDQHRRMLEQPEQQAGRELPRARQRESSGLTPFQKSFRDAIINQMRNTAGGAR